MQTRGVDHSCSGFQELIDWAIRKAAEGSDGDSAGIDYKLYFENSGGKAPPITPANTEVSTALVMIVLQTLMSQAAEGQLKALSSQVEAINSSSRAMLEEKLKKFTEMQEKQKAEQASKSRGGILGWIQKVAAVVLCVFVVAAVAVSTGGLGVAGGVALAFTILAACGALVDLGYDLAGESLAKDLGDFGAAAVTLSVGELAALSVRELGLPAEYQMAAAILATVITAVVMARLTSATGTLKELAKVMARSMDTPMRLNMMIDAVTTLGQGFETMDQAKIQRGISLIRAAMLETTTQITACDEQSKKVLDFLTRINELVTKFLEDVSRTVSSEFGGLTTLAEGRKAQPTMA